MVSSTYHAYYIYIYIYKFSIIVQLYIVLYTKLRIIVLNLLAQVAAKAILLEQNHCNIRTNLRGQKLSVFQDAGIGLREASS